jgi:hypothetical protein
LVNPFGKGYLHWIGQIHQSHAVGGANGFAMVVIMWIVVLVVDGTFGPSLGVN